MQAYHIKNRIPSIAAYIYLKNNPAKYHSASIWNEGALGICKQTHKDPKLNLNQQFWVLKIFPVILQTIITAQTMSIRGEDSYDRKELYPLFTCTTFRRMNENKRLGRNGGN